MTKVNIIVEPDWHGVPESVEMQIKSIQESNLNPDRTVILHEALPRDMSFLSAALRSNEDDEEFFERKWEQISLEKIWGPSAPYKGLFKFAYDQGIRVVGLDQSIEERVKFSKLIGLYIDHFLKTGESHPSVLREIKRQCIAREFTDFAQVINEFVQYGAYDTEIVITHPAHADRLVPYIRNVQGIATHYSAPSDETKLRLGGLEDEIQIKAAIDGRVAQKETPPIVPAITLAWGIPNMKLNDPLYHALEASSGRKVFA